VNRVDRGPFDFPTDAQTQSGPGERGMQVETARQLSGETSPSGETLRSVRWTVTLAASLGWFFDAYVITIYGLTIPLIAADFHVATNVLSGLVGSIFLVGYTIGTIAFGVCGDRFGRRVMLGISVIGYGVVTALTALASGVGTLAAFRFLTGVGGGGELSIGSPYVTEVWGRNSRSIGIGLMFAFYPLGYLFSILIFRLVTPVWGWRAVYLFSLVPALLILAMRIRLEESPRFSAVLSELRRTNSRRVGIIEASRDATFRRRVFVGFLIFTSLTYAFYAMAFYIPAYVVKEYHLDPATGAIVVPIFFEIGGLIGGLAGGFAGDLIGRVRPAITVAILGIAIIFLWWGLEWSLPAFCLMAACGGFVIGFEWTLGIIYVNEQFPTEIRASGFGWSVGLGRIVSIGAPVATQMLASSIGVAHAIQLSAFIWLFLIVGYWISDETRGSEIVDRVARAPKPSVQ
jgi:MFS transporter, putative metabolite:H+ symporter